ncbi:MAG: L-histidine N(alpha)-methyltransferase [Verrucomicrobiota bacterium]
MSCPVSITIHPSQFPENVRRDLLESLRSRQINHKFHYDSVNQAQKWLALHQAYSPSRTDPNCLQVYDQSFIAAAERIGGKRVHLIGLGCGGGQKDARLLNLLKKSGRELFYTPSDVSVAMVLVAQAATSRVIGAKNCFPMVCDLASPSELKFSIPEGVNSSRLLTFFGMIPNFEPQGILPKLAGILHEGDLLLFSANLAPGHDYAAGMRKILPLYDNKLTREWLQTFLLDLGVERSAGELTIKVESVRPNLRWKRVEANFCFAKRTRINLPEEVFKFRRGEKIRLFFSYRYTPPLLVPLLRGEGFDILDQWITTSGEEGVFLCRKSS